MSRTFLLLLLLGTAFAATHVNISIAEHSHRSPAAEEVSYVDGKSSSSSTSLSSSSAQLRAGPSDNKSHQPDFSYHNAGTKERAAKLQASSENSNLKPVQDNAEPKRSHDAGFYNDGRSARVQQFGQHDGQSSASEKAAGDHRRGFSQSAHHQRQPHSQFRQRPSEQDKQNHEFERYIQNYHSGPTVETVYESASSSPQQHKQSSSSSFSPSAPQRVVDIGARPAQTHKFERLVDLPTGTPALLPLSDAQAPTPGNLQAKPSTEVTKQTSSSSSTSTSTFISSSFAPGNDQSNFDQGTIYSKPSFDQTNFASGNEKPSFDPAMTNNNNNNKPIYEPSNFAPSNNKPNYDQGTSYQKPSFDQTNFAAGNGQPSFDQTTSYNKPNYDAPNFNYGGSAHDTDLYNQYPPSVNEPRGGGYYGDYYGNNAGSGYYGSGPSHSAGSYVPQRPVVTKTIQIAQPALKAKKYEIRHPAIQKEFYDIEERVVIKPAGTIVVELDHPVSKIPRGETILPLGHVHPAVAAAYNTHRHGVSQASPSSAAGSYSSSSSTDNDKQYSPSPVYNPSKPVYEEYHHHHNPVIGGTTIASAIASTPTNNPSSKDNLVEANLNRQFGAGDTQFVTTTERSYNDEKQKNNDLYLATDTHGNQHQISSKNLTPNMFGKDEPDRAPAVTSLSSNQQQSSNSLNHNDNSGAQATASVAPAQQLFQANYNHHSNNNPQYKGDFFAAEYYNSPNQQQQNFKPARLQEQPNFKPAYLQENQNFNQARVQEQQDFKPAHLQEQPDFKPAHLQGNQNFHQVSLQEQQDFKPARLQEQSAFNPDRLQENQDFKPARLQEQPVHNTMAYSRVSQPTHVIRLPPVQHNIYLGRLEQNPAVAEEQPQKQHESKHSAQLKSGRYEEEAARVLEIKPYLQQHKGPTILYAPAPATPNYNQHSQRYTQSEQSQPHFAQYRDQFRNAADGANRVHYSAPYSNMRYHPEESAHSANLNNQHDSNRKANLILENSKQDSAEEISAEELNNNNDSKMRAHTHIQIQIPHHTDEKNKPLVVSSTISPPMDHVRPAKYRLSLSTSYSMDGEPSDAQKSNSEQSIQRGDQEHGLSHSANLESKPDCDQTPNAHYESVPLNYDHDARSGNQGQLTHGQQKFMRLIEQPNLKDNDDSTPAAAPSAPAVAPAASNIQADEVDVNVKSTAGHVATPGSRVIAATAAPTGASAGSESFHKRRIVVNHPFQTVREVVEHEPYTNYHQVQVNEPAMHASYYQETHYQPTHGALQQMQTVGVPVYYQ